MILFAERAGTRTRDLLIKQVYARLQAYPAKIAICETSHIPITQIELYLIDIHFLPKANHAKSSVDFRVRTCGIGRGAIDCVFCAGSYDWECHRHQEQS